MVVSRISDVNAVPTFFLVGGLVVNIASRDR